MIGIYNWTETDEHSVIVVFGNRTILLGHTVDTSTGKPLMQLWHMEEPLPYLGPGEKHAKPDRAPEVIFEFDTEDSVDILQAMTDFVRKTFNERDESKYEDQIGTSSKPAVSDSETHSGTESGTQSSSKPASD
jgi:hypothetical protein